MSNTTKAKYYSIDAESLKGKTAAAYAETVKANKAAGEASKRLRECIAEDAVSLGLIDKADAEFVKVSTRYGLAFTVDREVKKSASKKLDFGATKR